MKGDNTSTIVVAARDNVPEWPHLDERPPGSLHIICGRRGTGKSTLLDDLLRIHAQYDEVCMFEPSLPERERLPSFISTEYIRDDYDDAEVRKLMEHAADAVKNGRNERRLLVIDDCAAHALRGDGFFQLCLSSRRWNIDVYIVVTTISAVMPSIRSNADYVFLMPTSSREDRQRYHREFFGNIGCLFKTLDGQFDAHAHDHGAVVFDRRSSRIFAYHARTDHTNAAMPVVKGGGACFNPRARPAGSVHLIVGARVTGKKTLLKHLLADRQYVDVRVVACLWSDQDALSNVQSHTADAYDDADIASLLAKAIAAKRNGRDERRALVLCDCFCGNAKEMAKQDALFQLCRSSRRCGIDVYVLVQDLRAVAPLIRGNADYVFLLRERQREALRIAHREYFERDCDNFGRFVEMVDERTRDYGAVVFDRSASGVQYYSVPE